MKSPSVERRESERHTMQGSVEFVIDETGDLYRGELVNLSKSGIYIALETPPAKDCLTAMCSLHITSQVGEEVVEIRAQARIARITDNSAGLHISKMDHATRVALVQIIRYAGER